LRYAISGRLSKPDPNRLKTMRQIAAEVAQELNRICASRG
jgi:hypothetical protein